MKQLLACLLVLCLALSLCACGASNAETKPAKTKPAETKPAESTAAKTEPAETWPAESGAAERIREGDELIAPFAELWTNELLDGFIRINPNWTWELLNERGEYLDGGACSYLEDCGLILELEDGGDWEFLYFDEDGWLCNSASMHMNMGELPQPDDRIREGDELIAPFTELWTNDGLNGFIRINADWTWELLDPEGAYLDGGPCSYLEEYGLILEYEDGHDFDFLRFDEDGWICNSVSEHMYMGELPEPDNVGVDTGWIPYEVPPTNGYSKLASQTYMEIYPMVVNLEDFSFDSAEYDPASLNALLDACELMMFRHPETRMYFRLDESIDAEENRTLYSVYFWSRLENANKAFIREKLEECEIFAGKVVARFDDDMTAYEKYRRLATVICYNAEYDCDNEAGTPTSPMAGLLGGPCLAEGYATALQYLCARADLYCEVVTGELQGQAHAWNLVKTPEGTFYIDIMRADQAGEPGDPAWMDYFMISEDELPDEYEIDDLY